MDISLIAGSSHTNTVLLSFSNLTGPADDVLGIGFYDIAPGIGDQIVITDIKLLASSFDVFEGSVSPDQDFFIGGNSSLLRISDQDGIGAALLRVQLEETPRSIFISNTGAFKSPPIAVATFSQITPIPEPSTMILLATGLIGLAGWGRKKFRNN